MLVNWHWWMKLRVVCPTRWNQILLLWKSKEYSYDITVTISTISTLYVKYKWNEDRIYRLDALIARFARMSSDSSEHAVAGIYSLHGNQMEMFNSLKKRFLGRVCNMKMHSYENFSTFLNRKISKIDNAWDDFSDFLESWIVIVGVIQYNL